MEIIPYPIEIGRVFKTKKDIYIISVNEYNGATFIDVRLHYLIEGNDAAPTKKGITLNLRTCKEVMEFLLEAYKKLEEIQLAKESEKSPES